MKTWYNSEIFVNFIDFCVGYFGLKMGWSPWLYTTHITLNLLEQKWRQEELERNFSWEDDVHWISDLYLQKIKVSNSSIVSVLTTLLNFHYRKFELNFWNWSYQRLEKIKHNGMGFWDQFNTSIHEKNSLSSSKHLIIYRNFWPTQLLPQNQGFP